MYKYSFFIKPALILRIMKTFTLTILGIAVVFGIIVMLNYDTVSSWLGATNLDSGYIVDNKSQMTNGHSILLMFASTALFSIVPLTITFASSTLFTVTFTTILYI